MAARLPDGATLALATQYGPEKDMTDVSNTDPAVATLEGGHGVVQGDFIEVTSGWARVNERVVKAGVVASNGVDVELLGINSTDIVKYPAGSGDGTIREITEFTQITQVLAFTTQGGDPTQVNYAFLEEDFERSLPGPAAAQTLQIGIADDSSLAGYQALTKASEDGSLRCLKMTLKNGDVILYNGVVSLNETPSVTKGQVMQVTATMNLQSRPVRYSA